MTQPRRVFDEGGRELTRDEVIAIADELKTPARVVAEFHTADGTPVTQVAIELAAVLAATVAGVRLIREVL